MLSVPGLSHARRQEVLNHWRGAAKDVTEDLLTHVLHVEVSYLSASVC